MHKRAYLNKKEHNSEYIQMRRNHMLSMEFCPECSNYNDKFPLKCCSRCSGLKKEKHCGK